MLTRSQTHFETLREQRRASRTIGAVQDVTERRTAEERLRVLDTVVSSSTQAIAIADAHGRLTFADAALSRLWGYSDRESLVGRSVVELCKSADMPAAALEQVRTGRIANLETLATRVDGTPLYLSISAEAVYDAKGGLGQVLLAFTDIAERKRLEAQLIHAQKMESIGRLAGGVAHDFNNMLTVISGGIELSLAALPPHGRLRGYLQGAADASRSAATLTRQLLAFSRKEVIAPRVLDLNEVIRRLEKIIARLLGEGVHLETRLAQDLTPICFDPGQVEQILLNLAINARDAMADGGRLTIETCNLHVEESYSESCADGRAAEYVLLAVSDDGAGMTDDVRAHLFEPFFTTKEAGKGTGLGLAMVYGAVQQNGGRIEFESEVKRGTTFKLYLPRATAAVAAAEALVALPASQPGSASILLVEDDENVRAFAKTVLEQIGYTIHALPCGADALACLSSLSPSPIS